MNLPSELVSSFVKATKDTDKKSNESTVYGVVVEKDGKLCVRIDGANSDQYTPISTTANVAKDDRVVVMIKDHSATIIGNISKPSATTTDVSEVGTQLTKLEILVSDKIDTDQLTAEIARIDTLITENVEIKGQLEANSAKIESLEAEDVVINNSLTAANARIDKLESTSITTDVLDAKYATIEKLEAVEADIYNLDATYGDFQELTTNNFNAVNAEITNLKAKDAEIENLIAEKATIKELEAETARIDDLEAKSLTADSAEIKNLQADIADIDTLIFGSASGDTIHVSFANAVIAQLADAQIKSAMIDSVSANKISSGDIITNNVRVLSEDGKLLISDETIQISDDTRVRVQIGKDAVGDYSINIWDTDGNLMFSEGGITDSAIKEAIIRDDMVSETANISATKLNIESLFSVINGDGTNTLSASKIKMDAEGQTLDVSFIKMTTDIENVRASANAAQATANQNASDMASIVTDFNADITNLQTQIDGSITTWFYEVAPTTQNEPAINWTTTDLKNVHLGDLYYDTITGYCYRWQVYNNVYSWQRITDTDVTKALADAQTAQDTADQKRRVFYSQPSPPYDLGDLWVQGSNGDILRCQVAKTSNQSYSFSDWILASKYTDDTAANAAQATANQNTSDISNLKTTVSSQGTDISVIQGQISSKVWQQDINTAKNEMSTQYSSLEQEVDSISATVASHTTQIGNKADSSTVTTVTNRVTALETDLDGFQATVSNTYATKTEVDDITIGGRNLLVDSVGEFDGSVINSLSPEFMRPGHDLYPIFEEYGLIEYTLSMDIKSADTSTNNYIQVYCQNGSGSYHSFNSGVNVTTEWQRLSVTFIPTADESYTDKRSLLAFYGGHDTGNIPIVKNLKLEVGNKATAWSPAPEDLMTYSDDAAENAKTEALDSVTETLTNYATLEITDSKISTAVSNSEASTKAYTDGKVSTALSSAYSYTDQTADSITSSVASTYTTIEDFQNLSIGGRNLLSNSEVERWTTRVLSIATYDILADYIDEPVTISFDARCDVDNGGIAREITVYPYQNNGISIANYSGYTLTNDWTRFSLTTTVKDWGINDETYTPGSIGFYDYTGTNYYGIRRIKIELGNIPTDWTPAPEDMATAKDNDTAQTTAENAQATADTAQTLVQQLSDNISMLVTDGNGTSLMTQTEDGWIFSTAEIQTAVNATSEGLSSLSTELGDTNNTVNVLQQAVDDLGEIAEYVRIGTYEDEPCIELGEGDSDFKLRITNTQILFIEGSSIVAHITNQSLHIKKAVVEEELQQGGFVWQVRSNGNMGLVWRGVSS